MNRINIALIVMLILTLALPAQAQTSPPPGLSQFSPPQHWMNWSYWDGTSSHIVRLQVYPYDSTTNYAPAPWGTMWILTRPWKMIDYATPTEDQDLDPEYLKQNALAEGDDLGRRELIGGERYVDDGLPKGYHALYDFHERVVWVPPSMGCKDFDLDHWLWLYNRDSQHLMLGCHEHQVTWVASGFIQQDLASCSYHCRFIFKGKYFLEQPVEFANQVGTEVDMQQAEFVAVRPMEAIIKIRWEAQGNSFRGGYFEPGYQARAVWLTEGPGAKKVEEGEEEGQVGPARSDPALKSYFHDIVTDVQWTEGLNVQGYYWEGSCPDGYRLQSRNGYGWALWPGFKITYRAPADVDDVDKWKPAYETWRCAQALQPK